MTLREALIIGRKELSGHRCPDSDPDREAELFLCRAAGLSREAALAAPEAELSGAQQKHFLAYIKRRLAHEPAAYIVGTAWFQGREFSVSPATLIPRPATETVADAAAAACARHPLALVLDVGTGSGCVAVYLAAAFPEARVIGLDVAAAALKTARRNAAAHRVGRRATFRRSDLLAGLSRTDAAPGRAVVIAANLPYLPSAIISGLAPEVRDFEPRIALDGGPDGLDLCRRLIGQAADRFAGADLHLVLELLPEQYAPLAAFARKKIPGLKAGRILNLSGICVGAALRRGCAAVR